jgi:hypothetical protein
LSALADQETIKVERSSRRCAWVLVFSILAAASSVRAQETPAPPAQPPDWLSVQNQPPAQTPVPPPGSYPPPSPVQGPVPPPAAIPPGYVLAPPPNVHDGFYLRLHLGFGMTSIKGEDGRGAQNTLAGMGTSFGLALGGTVVRNLAVFGTFTFNFTDRPTVSDGLGNSGTASGSLGLYAVGAGVVYYLQPFNLYVSGALTGVQLGFMDEDDRTVYESKFGVGFQGIVGKEWWVSSEWGLGIALETILAGYMKDADDPSVRWSGHAFTLLFSATYN